MNRKYCITILMTFLIIGAVRADPLIQVLFVFDDQTRTSIIDKDGFVSQQIGAANSFLARSGQPILQFNGNVSTAFLSYSTAGKYPNQVIGWMHGNGDQLLESLRGSNDLIVLVGSSILGPKCGIASDLRDNISPSNSNVQQYALITLGGCENPPGLLLAHELGHLLSLEHQVTLDELGKVVTDGDEAAAKPSDSHSVHSPKTKNHGYWASSREPDDLRTLMASPQDASATIFKYTDGSAPYDATYENAMDVIGNGGLRSGSFDSVSRYRNPSPITACVLQYEFSGCNGSAPMGQITALLPGYTVTNATYEVKFPSGGWNEIFDGILACVGISPDTIERARAILTTAYGLSQCEIPIPNPSCGGNQQPW